MSYFWSQIKFFMENTYSTQNGTNSEFLNATKQNITWNPYPSESNT